MNASRRRDDPEQIEPEQVEAFFTNLPELARQVEANRRESTRGRQRLAFLFLFITVVGITAGVLLQRQAGQNTRTLRETRQTGYEQCQVANDNATALNNFLDIAIAATRSSDALSASEKRYRVSLYESIKQTLPVCEKP